MTIYYKNYEDLMVRLRNSYDSLEFRRNDLGQIFQIRFRLKGGEVFYVVNDMLDLDEYVEIGTIVISDSAKYNDSSYYKDIKLEVDETYFNNPKIILLENREEETAAIAGIKIITSDNNEHLILTGDTPYSLVFISSRYKEARKSEYSLECYKPMPD